MYGGLKMNWLAVIIFAVATAVLTAVILIFEQPEAGRILIEAHKYGETGITVTDGEKEYRHTIVIYDDNGVDRA